MALHSTQNLFKQKRGHYKNVVDPPESHRELEGKAGAFCS